MMKKVLVPAALLGLVLAAAGAASAFEFTMTAQPLAPPVQGESASGTYSLAPLEQLAGVYILSYDKHGNWSSTAEGTFDPDTGTWAASLRDSDMAYYQIEFVVHYGNNQVYYDYYSNKYAWGKGP